MHIHAKVSWKKHHCMVQSILRCVYCQVSTARSVLKVCDKGVCYKCILLGVYYWMFTVWRIQCDVCSAVW